MTEFDDIRPYNDAEVPAVIARLVADPEFLNLLLSELEKQFVQLKLASKYFHVLEMFFL